MYRSMGVANGLEGRGEIQARRLGEGEWQISGPADGQIH